MSVRSHAPRLALLLTLVVAACGAPLSYGPDAEPSAHLLTADELRAITATNALEAVQQLKAQRWYGNANRLSRDDPVNYEAIDHVAAASRKP